MSTILVGKAGYPSAGTDDETDTMMALSEARANFPSLVNEAAEHGQRVIITKFGRPAAAIVPIYDLERLMAVDTDARALLRVDDTTDAEVIDLEDEAATETCISAARQETIQRVGNLVRELLSDPEIRHIVENAEQENDLPPPDSDTDVSVTGRTRKFRRSSGDVGSKSTLVTQSS